MTNQSKASELIEKMKAMKEFLMETEFNKIEFKEEKGIVSMKLTEDKWASLPKGWTRDSVKSFWNSLTGDHKHKVTACINKMKGKMDDPGAFCGGLASKLGER